MNASVTAKTRSLRMLGGDWVACSFGIGDKGAMGDEPTGTETTLREATGPWSAISGGLLGGFLATSLSISLTGLIFAGPLRAGLGVAISASLIGGALMALVLALKGSSPGMVAGIQDSPAAVIAAATAAIAASASADTSVPTAFAAVGLTSILVGIVFWTAGRWRLGRALRFVPFPVVLGFVAATGTVVMRGALDQLTLGSATMRTPILGAGLAVGALLFVGTRAGRSRYVLLPVLMAAGILINLWANLGVGRATAVAEGWFLGPFADTTAIDLFVMGSIGDADWGALAGQAGVLLTAVVVGLVGYLLNAPSLAETTGAAIRVDDDLEPIGIANVAAGLIGSPPGYLMFGTSLAVSRVAGLRRSSGLIAAAFGVGIALAGSRVFNVIPTAVVGGILIFIASNLLTEALWSNREYVTQADSVLVVAMMLAVLLSSFGAAIVLGLVGAVTLFVVRYAQIDVVHRELWTADFPGIVERSGAERAELETLRAAARLIEVKGFVFFGTARHLADRIFQLDDGLRYLILDLSRVTGIDSSAASTLRTATRRTGATIVVCGGSKRLSGWAPEGSRRFDHATTAVTWVEDQLLSDRVQEQPPLPQVLAEHGPDTAANELASYFTCATVPADSILIREGEQHPGLMYIESGECDVLLSAANGVAHLRKLHAGTFVGEISMYDVDPHATATVRAAVPCRVWHLDLESLNGLEREAPEAAMLLHRVVASTMARRLRYTNSVVRTLWADGTDD